MGVFMTVASPCVRNCCLDKHDICMGCFRSLEEIKQWGVGNDTHRRDILLNAKLRRLKNHKKYHCLK